MKIDSAAESGPRDLHSFCHKEEDLSVLSMDSAMLIELTAWSPMGRAYGNCRTLGFGGLSKFSVIRSASLLFQWSSLQLSHTALDGFLLFFFLPFARRPPPPPQPPSLVAG